MADQFDKKSTTRLRLDDGVAFERLYHKYNRKLYNFAFKMLHSRVESEGIVQDTFIKLWENRKKLDDSLSVSGYLFKIAQNKIYNLFRSRINDMYYREYLKEYAHKLETTLEEKIDQNDLFILFEQLIDKLPDRRKEIFLLSRNEGLTYKQIAVKLGISENTVDTQIRKALDFFRQNLREKYLSMYS
jgi:RNA polymerase sigma-70 factor (ECF subfamily)